MRLGLTGKDFIPFSQFYLSDAVRAKLNLEAITYSKKQIKKVEKTIFANKAIYRLFVSMITAKGKRKKALEKRLLSLRKKHKD